MKRVLAICLFFSLLLGLSACGRDKGRDGDFAYPITREPDSLDPQIVTSNAEEITINNCMEGLVRLGEDGKILPGVAERWDIAADKMQYTFYLRKDAQWYLTEAIKKMLPEDVVETFDIRVRAQDFVFGLQRALMPDIHAPDASMLYCIQNAQRVHTGEAAVSTLGVSAPDDFTVKITLAQPSEDLLRTLTTAIAMPCNEVFYSNTQGRYGLESRYLLCNGPFILYSWKENSSLVLRRNPNYTGDSEVIPATVTLRVDQNVPEYAKKLQDGAYSACPLPSGDTTEWGKDYTVLERENCVLSLIFHCGNTALRNTDIRLALAGRLDRSSFSPVYVTDTAARGLLPNGCIVGQENYRDVVGDAPALQRSAAQVQQDLQKGLKARKLETLPALTILCTAPQENLARKVLQQWQQDFGIQMVCSVQVVEELDLESRLAAGNFTIALAPIYAHADAAQSFLDGFTSGHAENVSRYQSTTFDQLMQTVHQAPSLQETANGCRQAENHLLQNAVVVPIFQQKSQFALGSGISGVYFHPDGQNIFFRDGRVAS